MSGSRRSTIPRHATRGTRIRSACAWIEEAGAMAHIKLTNWPAPINVGRGTVLETALAAGVAFPHGCMSGECGTCKCRLVAGEVAHDGHSRDALTESERRAGLI